MYQYAKIISGQIIYPRTLKEALEFKNNFGINLDIVKIETAQSLNSQITQSPLQKIYAELHSGGELLSMEEMKRRTNPAKLFEIQGDKKIVLCVYCRQNKLSQNIYDQSNPMCESCRDDLRREDYPLGHTCGDYPEDYEEPDVGI